jgi:TldD protein
MKKSILLLAVLLIFQADTRAQRNVILSAMKDELARSVHQLKLEDEAGPYYVSYLLQDSYTLGITADSGAITSNSDNRGRTLRTDLRVGSYTQDNSNFLSLNLGNLTDMLSASSRIPIDDDYEVLRRQIWRVTDTAYKNALETLTKKKAALQNAVQTETLPDFTKSEAISNLAPEASLTFPKAQWTQLVDQISKLFLGQPKIQKSRVRLDVHIANSYYVNSEGTVSVQPSGDARLSVTAMTQADDGMPLNNFLVYAAASPEGLPDKARLESDIKTMIADLMAARTAPAAEEYSGPVLFIGQAAGELFGQGFSSLLAARKVPLSDNPQMTSMFGRVMENPFLNKINTKVAANFLSVKAAPTLKSYNQKALLGSYAVDEEGIASRDVSLIENGILKNLLMTRTPVKGFAQSNGHFRGGAAAPSVIQIASARKLNYPQLKQELIKAAGEESLPYGYLVKGLTPMMEALSSNDMDLVSTLMMAQQGPPDPTQFRLTRPYSVFRVYPDGREEPVRGVEFGAVSINAFKNIIATSDEEIVYDYPASSSLLQSGLGGLLSMMTMSGMPAQAYATVITPSFLIGGIDLKKVSGTFRKPPIVAYPIK